MVTIKRFEDLVCWQKARAFQNGLKLTDECSRLIQSFSEKLKGGGQIGLQFKRVPAPDKLEEFMKEHSPELYKKFYVGESNG